MARPEFDTTATDLFLKGASGYLEEAMGFFKMSASHDAFSRLWHAVLYLHRAVTDLVHQEKVARAAEVLRSRVDKAVADLEACARLGSKVEVMDKIASALAALKGEDG